MKKIFHSSDIDRFNRIYNLLGFQEEKRKKLPFSKLSVVTYKKEREVPNYKVLKAKYEPFSTIPFFFVILFVAIAVALATAYLIINFTMKDANKDVYFFSLMLPTSLFTLLAAGVSFYRYFVELKNVERLASVLLLEKEVNKL